MSTMVSQITGVAIVYSIVGSGADQRKHQSSAPLAYVFGNLPVTGEYPAQKASDAENASIWWRHYNRIYVIHPQISFMVDQLFGQVIVCQHIFLSDGCDIMLSLIVLPVVARHS